MGVGLYEQSLRVSESAEYTLGTHLYIRSRVVYLDSILASVARSQQDRPVKYIHLYCDTLSLEKYPNDGRLRICDLDIQGLAYVYIFARDFLQTLPLTGLDFTGIGTLKIRLFSQEISPIVESSLASAGYVTSDLSVNKFAVTFREIRLLGGEVEIKGLPSVPFYETDPPLFEPRKDLKYRGGPNELAKFLEFQYHAVIKLLFSQDANLPGCMSRLRFIATLSSTSAALGGLSTSARTLLQRMELPLRYPSTISVGEVSLRIAVPSLKLDRYLDELQSQIDATTQVQVEIDKIETKEQITKSTDLVLEGISTSIESFYDLNSDRKSMDDAVALVIARAKLVEQASTNVEVAGGNFERGMKELAKKKKEEFYSEIGKAVVGLLVTVGIACYTSGAGAPLAAGNIQKISDLMEKGQKLVSAWDRIKHVLVKLAEVMVKLYPNLMASHGTSNAMESSEKHANTIASRLTKNSATLAISSSVMPKVMGEEFDYIGLMADWEEMKVTIDETFKQFEDMLRPDIVSGLTEYRMALRKMCVQGQTLLEARRLCQAATLQYLRNYAESSARLARGNAIKQLLADDSRSPTDKGLSMDLYKVQLQEILRERKRQMLLTIHTCCLSLAYLTVSPWRSPFTQAVDVDMDVIAFTSALSNLKVRRNFKESDMGHHQDVSVTYSTDDLGSEKAFGDLWKPVLLDQRRIEFILPSNSKDLTEFWKLRLRDMEVCLEGLQQKPGITKKHELRYKITFGPQSVDLDKDGKSVQYFLRPIDLRKLSFAKNKQRWIVEGNDHVFPTPLSRIEVSFSKDDLEYFDLSTVTGITISMECTALS